MLSWWLQQQQQNELPEYSGSTKMNPQTVNKLNEQ